MTTTNRSRYQTTWKKCESEEVFIWTFIKRWCLWLLYRINLACAYQGVRNIRFFGQFDVLRFLVTPVLGFALLPYYRRIMLDYTWIMPDDFRGYWKGSLGRNESILYIGAASANHKEICPL